MSQASVPTTASPLRAVRRPSFVVVAIILLLAAVTLNVAWRYQGVVFRKESVAMQKSFDLLPRSIGPWVQVSIDAPLPEEQEHALGTKNYIMRWYVDSRRAPKGSLENLSKMTQEERQQLLGQVINASPGAAIQLHTAYYTGKADTVAHVPDRCYVGGGFDPIGQDYVGLKLHPPTTADKVEVRYIEFEDRATRSLTKRVGYFFSANGQRKASSDDVRAILQNLLERRAYYAKIEMLSFAPSTSAAQAEMTDFLSFAMPELDKCLPIWNAPTSAAP